MTALILTLRASTDIRETEPLTWDQATAHRHG